MVRAMKLKIKKNDQVMVIAGDDKGKIGRVLDVDPKKMRILVEGVNIHTKHQRPTQQNQKGGRIEMEFPIHYSNVMLIDSEKNRTRISIKREEKGGRVKVTRIAKTNGKEI
jgi:large subunit ribosomal protein L24